ncbi:hypothetical protein ND910_07020 [Schaalia meyeri]|uniref:hypothetical protein n=1 Tax=Schaalia meyeri TaxID=52773 RepID=UPI0020445C95|nr:hypothetical protein [Schaalia meyeri]MCM3899459.1 hypothetical protein [Schaalia meyeri]
MTLTSGWRFITREEVAELGFLAKEPSVRAVAVRKTEGRGSAPTFVITGGELRTNASEDEIYADSIQQVQDALPGFHLIDDFAWPLTPKGARWRTGVYILDNASLTLTQLTWITRAPHAGPGSPRRPLWTEPCTCPSTNFPAFIDDFITMAQTLEVTP